MVFVGGFIGVDCEHLECIIDCWVGTIEDELPIKVALWSTTSSSTTLIVLKSRSKEKITEQCKCIYNITSGK